MKNVRTRASTSPKAAARRPSPTASRVLVVNDTQEILELFEEILGEMGLEATLMSFAPRELAQIRDLKPDLIILDFVFGNARRSAGSCCRSCAWTAASSACRSSSAPPP